MTEIDERQQKRAANIVWNCAGRYDFRPDFRAYDVKGRADLYWNCIFGAARKHYDYAVFAQIFAGLQQYEDADTYTDLFWLGLENCVYQRELPQRPALEALRRRYAEQFVRQHQGAEDFQFYDSLALAHFSRVLGLESRMNKYDSKLLDELEFTPEQYPAVVKKCALVWMRYEGSTQMRPAFCSSVRYCSRLCSKKRMASSSSTCLRRSWAI